MSKWISVKERLPKFDEFVLIYAPKTEDISIALINQPHYRGSFWFYPDNYGWSENDVTHWMHLPPIPEETE